MADRAVVQSDVKAILTSWVENKKKTIQNIVKPVIIFCGYSGVGKSSIIQALIPNIQVDDISHHGAEGTRQARKYENDYCILVDVRGRTINESKDQYEQYISEVFTQFSSDKTSVNFIYYVVNCYETRDTDLENLKSTADYLNHRFKKHFMILMNKHDHIKTLDQERRFKERKNLCDQLFSKIGISFFSLSTVPMYKGTYELAANPSILLPLTCPDEPKACKTYQKHKITSEPGRYVACDTCKSLFVTSDNALEPDEEEYFNGQQYRISCQKAVPENLGIGSPIVKNMLESIDDIAIVNILKAVAKNISDKSKSAIHIIDRFIKLNHSSDSSQADQKLCSNIAQLYDFPCTGTPHSQYEMSLWKENRSWFPGFVERILGNLYHMENFLAAWGIFYALKYQNLDVFLLQHFTENRNNDVTNDLIEKCEHILENCSRSQVQNIYEFIEKHGRKRAYEFYLKLDSLDDEIAVGCLGIKIH